MIMAVPKPKRSDAIRVAYLAGLKQGFESCESYADWIQGSDSDRARKSLQNLHDKLAADIDAGAKPWSEPAKRVDPVVRRSSTSSNADTTDD